MKDYFAVLEISSDASTREIKKAYFKMLRKYHPDRYPEEFMKIREAYEVLSDEQTRKEYQEFDQLDDFVKMNFELAREIMEEGNYQRAIYMLQELVVYRYDTMFLRGYLGEAYLKNGNTGKAIDIFEELTKRVPKHAGYAGNLAKAYLNRGWHKKAINAFYNALELDEDNFSLWIGLYEAHIDNRDYDAAEETLQLALEKGKAKDWDQLSIYYYLIQVNLFKEEYEAIFKWIQEIKSIGSEEKGFGEHLAWMLMDVGAALIKEGRKNLGEALFKEAHGLVPDNKEIKSMGEIAQKVIPLENELTPFMSDTRIQEEIKSFIQLAVLPSESMGIPEEDQEMYIKISEMEIMVGYGDYRFSLSILEKEYPQLYALRKKFLDQIKNKKQREQLIKKKEKNSKELTKMIHFLEKNDMIEDGEEWEEYDPFSDELYMEKQEPYVREQPKVGRNDPCPCGSGKKYKRCCGR